MNYYIIAGEVSGDMHGSQLVEQLSLLDKNAVFKGVGGEHLQNANVELVFSLDRMAFMGFYEVLKNLFTIRKNFKEIKQSISFFKPDVVLLIDYPGFNLRMAKWCKNQGYKVVYYISPKLWAWNEKRVHKIKNYVDLMLCILPFEEDFYRKHQYYNAHYVGHPLLDRVSLLAAEENEMEKPVIALLPGSRQQEIKSLLPVLLQTASAFPDEKFIISGMTKMKKQYPDSLPSNISIVFDDMYSILKRAKAAVVCSGTATLETALFNVPQVVIYKTSSVNYEIGKRLATVKYISLPNLIVNDKLVEELIQKDCHADAIIMQLNKMLKSDTNDFYKSLNNKLGEKGVAKRAAGLISAFLLSNK